MTIFDKIISYFMSVMCSKGHMSRILYCVTHQGITTGKQKGLLYGGWIIANHINNQFHIPWLTNFSVNYKYISMLMSSHQV